jgi:hypothetical protein
MVSTLAGWDKTLFSVASAAVVYCGGAYLESMRNFVGIS